ncbi:MAG: type II secretion system F family protein [Beijerinckiaceae bacterium]
METLFDLIDFLIADPLTIILAVAAAGALGLSALLGQWWMVRGDVKRRARRVSGEVAAVTADGSGQSQRNVLVSTVMQSVDRLFGEGDQATAKVLRKRLVQAGYYSPTAPATFLLIRVGGMAGLAAIGFLVGILSDDHITTTYIKMVGGAGIGYLVPPVMLDKIIGQRKEQHRQGFPDFLDLMIVCCEAGLSMEASINRVCREMADAYPSLSANLYFATLEIRAGRTVNDALMNLSDRLIIEEARTFATLLQQSAELGSSLIDSLKIYSDDMRNKRMMNAEERANALPTKMMIPMMVFIFPILFIILLFPAYMRVKGSWQ